MSEQSMFGGHYGLPSPEQPQPSLRNRVTTWAGLGLLVGGLIALGMNGNGEKTPDASPSAPVGASPSPSAEAYIVEGETDIDRSCSMLVDQAIGKPVTVQHVKTGIKETNLRNKTLRLYGLHQAEDVISQANIGYDDVQASISSWKLIGSPSIKKQAGEALVQDAISDLASQVTMDYETAEDATKAYTVIAAVKGSKAEELQMVPRLKKLGAQVRTAEDDDPAREKNINEATSIYTKAQERLRKIEEDIAVKYNTGHNAICDASPEWQQTLKEQEEQQQAYDKECDILAEPARDTCEANHALAFITTSDKDPGLSLEWSKRISKDNMAEQARIDTAEADKAIDYIESGDEGFAEPWSELVATPTEAYRIDVAEANKAIELVSGGYGDLGYPFSDKVASPDQKARVDQAYFTYVKQLHNEGYGSLGQDVADHISDPALRKQAQAIISND